MTGEGRRFKRVEVLWGGLLEGDLQGLSGYEIDFGVQGNYGLMIGKGGLRGNFMAAHKELS